MFLDYYRRKLTVAVPGNLQRYIAKLTANRLFTVAVSTVLGLVLFFQPLPFAFPPFLDYTFFLSERLKAQFILHTPEIPISRMSRWTMLLFYLILPILSV